MEIIMFRHGIAQDFSEDGSDFSRALTDDGIKRTKLAATGLAKIIDTPDLILTSPKVRAVQTANIITHTTDGPEPVICDIIAEDSAVQIAHTILKYDVPTLVVVGHEPTLSLAAELLCTGYQRLDLFDLKKAGAIAINLPKTNRKADGPGRLIWSATPSMLRQMAKL